MRFLTRIFNSEWFKLEKKRDGLYRCRGGHLADFILLGGSISYLFFLWIMTPLNSLIDKIINLGYAIYFKLRK